MTRFKVGSVVKLKENSGYAHQSKGSPGKIMSKAKDAGFSDRWEWYVRWDKDKDTLQGYAYNSEHLVKYKVNNWDE